jgi:lipopolysaccharide transport system permease protein
VLEPTVTTPPVIANRAEESRPVYSSLPEEPLVTIESGRAWAPVNLRELWAYRELLYFLAWRDIKVRYKQTLMGVAWVVVQPLLLTLIFTLFLGVLARVPSDGVPYPLLVFAGLLPWSFFSSAVATGAVSMVSNSHLVTKIYFPRLLVPFAAVAARLIDFAIASVILGGMMLYYRQALTPSLLMAPVLVALLMLFTTAVSTLTAALNAKYRDIGVMLPVLLQLWMYVSPVLYPIGLIPEAWRGFYILNPLVGIIDGFRSAVLGRPFNWPALAVTVTVTLLLLAYSLFAFRRAEKSFADVI